MACTLDITAPSDNVGGILTCADVEANWNAVKQICSDVAGLVAGGGSLSDGVTIVGTGADTDRIRQPEIAAGSIFANTGVVVAQPSVVPIGDLRPFIELEVDGITIIGSGTAIDPWRVSPNNVGLWQELTDVNGTDILTPIDGARDVTIGTQESYIHTNAGTGSTVETTLTVAGNVAISSIFSLNPSIQWVRSNGSAQVRGTSSSGEWILIGSLDVNRILDAAILIGDIESPTAQIDRSIILADHINGANVVDSLIVGDNAASESTAPTLRSSLFGLNAANGHAGVTDAMIFGHSTNTGAWTGTTVTNDIIFARAPIGVGTPYNDVLFDSDGSVLISRGDTLQRTQTPIGGEIRYNTDTQTFEGYYTIDGTADWYGFGGGASNLNSYWQEVTDGNGLQILEYDRRAKVLIAGDLGLTDFYTQPTLSADPISLTVGGAFACYGGIWHGFGNVYELYGNGYWQSQSSSGANNRVIALGQMHIRAMDANSNLVSIGEIVVGSTNVNDAIYIGNTFIRNGKENSGYNNAMRGARQSVYIGHNVGERQNAGTGRPSYNTIVGDRANSTVVTRELRENVMVGAYAGAEGDISRSIVIGGSTSGGWTGATIDNEIWFSRGNAVVDPYTNVTFDATGALLVPRGTTAQQPTTPVDGMFRYSTERNTFEGRIGGSWVDIPSAAGGVSFWSAVSPSEIQTADAGINTAYIGQTAGDRLTLKNDSIVMPPQSVQLAEVDGQIYNDNSLGRHQIRIDGSLQVRARPTLGVDVPAFVVNGTNVAGATWTHMSIAHKDTGGTDRGADYGFRGNTGNPENVVIARRGSMLLQADGRAYLKEDAGDDATGWGRVQTQTTITAGANVVVTPQANGGLEISASTGGGVAVISDLGDVDDSGRAPNDLLTWNGTNWVATAPTTGLTISFDGTGVPLGDLAGNAATVYSAIAGTGISITPSGDTVTIANTIVAVNDLDDVAFTKVLEDGDVLQYNLASGDFENVQLPDPINIDTSGANIGDILVFDGTDFTPVDFPDTCAPSFATAYYSGVLLTVNLQTASFTDVAEFNTLSLETTAQWSLSNGRLVYNGGDNTFWYSLTAIINNGGSDVGNAFVEWKLAGSTTATYTTERRQILDDTTTGSLDFITLRVSGLVHLINGDELFAQIRTTDGTTGDIRMQDVAIELYSSCNTPFS